MFSFVLYKVKNTYESIEIEGLKFTTQWVGIIVAQVSDDDDAFSGTFLL